jgi:hypothetical protein
VRSLGRGRFISRVLLVPLAAGMIAGGGSLWHALAEDATGADCITSYHAEGWTQAIGEGVEIPAENVLGQPYALGRLIDVPVSHAKASSVFPGFIAEAVYSLASDKMPPYPEEAEAFAPKPHDGVDADAHDYGPLMSTKAVAKPTEMTAEATLGSVPSAASSLAHVDMTFDGKNLHGDEYALAYDVNLGPLHIGQVTSVIKWTNDGTQEGTSEKWTVKFTGVEVNGQAITSANGEGFSFQGGAPQPGPQARDQATAQLNTINDALRKAGVGALEMKMGTTRSDISAGHIDLNGTALTFRFEFEPRKASPGQGTSLQFGRSQLDVLVGRGSCEDAKQPVNDYKNGPLPTGPNIQLTPEPESAHFMPGLPPVPGTKPAASLPAGKAARVHDSVPVSPATRPALPALPLVPVADKVRDLLPALPPVEPLIPPAPAQQPGVDGGGGLMP